MEKLELKHLAPYLPYGLMVKDSYSDKILKLTGLDSSDEPVTAIDKIVNQRREFKEIKPILRPLSDLSKYVEYNGEEIPFNHLLKAVSYGFTGPHPPDSEVIGNRIRSQNLLFHDAQMLFRYHFDVDGLIESGLAVDINTL